MKIYKSRCIKNLKNVTGSSPIIQADCVMMDKYGNIYPCIDNKYHPNPGTAEDGYSEIERTVDWLISNNIYPVYDYIDKWLRGRLSQEYLADENLDDAILNVLFCDDYTPCKKILKMIELIWNEYQDDSTTYVVDRDSEIDELYYSRKIAEYLNEHFLRIRAGGKLNPEGSDSIYFRISSHDVNWRGAIIDFLWDTFGGPNDAPSYIWIGHDAETNPPEVTLFEGTFSDLLNMYDGKVFSGSNTEGGCYL